eukprot:3933626-Alexandrium_andersonii.AAC.1
MSLAVVLLLSGPERPELGSGLSGGARGIQPGLSGRLFPRPVALLIAPGLGLARCLRPGFRWAGPRRRRRKSAT